MAVRTTEQRQMKYVYKPDPLTDAPPEDLLKILDEYRGLDDALITVLKEIQVRFGYLPEKHLQYTARELQIPLSQVYGVATFYNLFLLEAPGKHQVKVCKGTACFINQAPGILARLEQELGVGEDETTADGLITLQTVACVGACSLAPVLVVDEEAHGRLSPDEAWSVVAALREKAGSEQ